MRLISKFLQSTFLIFSITIRNKPIASGILDLSLRRQLNEEEGVRYIKSGVLCHYKNLTKQKMYVLTAAAK